jgi:hypothetical protein
LFLSLAFACALAFGSLAAQEGTPAPSPKAAKTAGSEKSAKKPKETKGKEATAKEATAKEATAKEATAKEATAKEATAKEATAKETTAKETKATGTKAKPESTADEGEEEIDIPVPDGVPVKGIKVPSYSPEGKLVMMLDAEQARKLDAERIEFENLKIDAYSDDDKKIYVELPRSIFNLTTRILTSESRVLIRREDFELVGDAGEFYTKNRFAKILGNVKMTILSTENFNTP